MAKILLVEDDNNLREIYEARLQAEGYNIVSARDGEEALVVAKAEKPDLVISDVMMPKISGFEMLDILRNTDGLKDVKVVMLTALGQTEDQQRASKLGADRYLVKSQVTLEDIVKAAHDLLGDEGAAAETKDDKIMNDAVNSLTSSAASDDTASDMPAPTTAPVTPVAVATPPDTDDDNDSDSELSQVPVAHKKIIQPIDTGPSKDIHTLLAEEEAKEAKQAAGDASTASQPVQPAPTPELQSEPAPQASLPTTDAANIDAPSAAKEEAGMDAKIEDFVAGASSEPTPPSSQPAPVQQTPPIPQPTPAQPQPAIPQNPPAQAQPAPQQPPQDPNIIAL